MNQINKKDDSELEGFIKFLYRYFISFKWIVFKIRGKHRGRLGQLTDEEINFIEKIYELYEEKKRLDST